jgi:hypothetical protein
MKTITQDQLNAYHQKTFLLDSPITTKEQGIEFVKQRGFVYFWPIKGVRFPSMWSAVAGDREVANEHGDAGHVTWGWKDELLGKDAWYYGKILRGKGTMIAPDIVPYFYALSENFGEPETDYLQVYEDGLMTREAKQVYEELLKHGALDTVRLRREAHLAGKAGKYPFDRALVALQQDFKIMPMGLAEAGGWGYSHVYDCVHRVYPELPALARPISQKTAREKLVALYFESIGAATVADVKKLFQWDLKWVKKAVEGLVNAGILQPATVAGKKGFALSQFGD